jgi:hypothetical protein
MGQVNVPTDLERGELLAEKVDRREFIDLLKRMLTMDQVNLFISDQKIVHVAFKINSEVYISLNQISFQ